MIVTNEKLEKIRSLHPYLKILNINGRFLDVEDNYGICKVQVYPLLVGNKPTIATALDKNSYFSNQLKEVNTNLTLISDYKNARTKVLIKDKYGVCEVLPGHVLRQIPCIETAVNKSQYFINKAKEIHQDTYDYTNTIFKNGLTKLSIICKKHGEFKQDPFTHLKGMGCIKCGRENLQGYWYKNINNQEKYSSFYILKFENEFEIFKKFGVTVNLPKRLESLNRQTNHQYKITVIRLITSTVRYCFALEKKFKSIIKLRGALYTTKHNFCGKHECFI
jgi:hypothetical protein